MINHHSVPKFKIVEHVDERAVHVNKRQLLQVLLYVIYKN